MDETTWLHERLKTHAWIAPGIRREVMNTYALLLREATADQIPMVSEAAFVDAYRHETAIEWTLADRVFLADGKIAP